MQIDWVTVAAQIVNFLVLVWLLNKVLYRPVTRALRARAEAEREAERLREARAELEATRAEKLRAIEEEVEERRETLTEEARAEIAAQREEWHRQLEREREAFLRRLRERAEEAMARLLGRALADLADSDLEARIAAVFATKLEATDAPTRAELRRAAHAAEAAPRIAAAFPLDDPTRSRVEDAVRAILGADAEPQVERDTGIDCGIVLEVGSRRIEWTIGAYLDALTEEIAGALDGGAPAAGRTDGEGETPAPAREASC